MKAYRMQLRSCKPQAVLVTEETHLQCCIKACMLTHVGALALVKLHAPQCWLYC